MILFQMKKRSAVFPPFYPLFFIYTAENFVLIDVNMKFLFTYQVYTFENLFSLLFSSDFDQQNLNNRLKNAARFTNALLYFCLSWTKFD